MINSYTPGEFNHVSFDFIMKKGDGIDENKEIAQTRYETVYKDFDVIINTRSASLNMTIYHYPICKGGKIVVQRGVTGNRQNGLDIFHKPTGEKRMMLIPGMRPLIIILVFRTP